MLTSLFNVVVAILVIYDLRYPPIDWTIPRYVAYPAAAFATDLRWPVHLGCP